MGADGPRRPGIAGWFESRLEPFPDAPPRQPPRSLVAFCLHYTRGAGGWLALMALLGALVAVGELTLYVYLGALVDRLGEHTPASFLAVEGPRLAWMAVLVAIGLPLVVLLESMVQLQVLLGNFPMRIRWNVHRYLLRQSMDYFQDEFAGRIATKLMQTSLAVRETVIKLLDVGVYIVVYVFGAMLAAAAADWRLMLPFAGWFTGYVLLMRFFKRYKQAQNRE